MGNEQGKVLDTTTPEGVKAMDENLQRKFSKGIQYNSKLITFKSIIIFTATFIITCSATVVSTPFHLILI